MRNYKFDAEKVWPEEEATTEPSAPSVNTSTPKKPETETANIFSIPLYKRLLEDNSFNSSLDEEII